MMTSERRPESTPPMPVEGAGRRDRTRELGATVVAALHHLIKGAQLHAADNQAVRRLVEGVRDAAREYEFRAGRPFEVLFTRAAVFVAGRPLRASRAGYEAAMELAAALERCGGSELEIGGAVTESELRTFAVAVAAVVRDARTRFLHVPSPMLTLRAVDQVALLQDLEVEHLDAERRMVRIYACSVVALRGFFEHLGRAEPADPRRIKHLAQDLVDLSAGRTPAFLGVTAVRNANHDDAGRAVNTAILAVAMARQITDDRIALMRIAMAAMLYDAGKPRALRGQRLDTDGSGDEPGVTMQLGDEADRALPAGTAAVLTALGRVNEPSMVRSVVAYEALWLARGRRLGTLYRGLRPPTLHARIVAIARRFNEILTPAPGEAPRSASDALIQLDEEVSAAPGTGKSILGDNVDRTVLRLLIGALGVLPPGTLVELSSGEIAVVVTSGIGGEASGLTMRIVLDESGAMPDRPRELALDSAPGISLVKIVGTDPTFVRRTDASHAPSPTPPPPSMRAPPAASSSAGAPPSTRPSLLPSALDEPFMTPTLMKAPKSARPGEDATLHDEAIFPDGAPVSSQPPSSRGAGPSSLPYLPPPPAPPLPKAPTRKAEVRGTLATSPVPHLLVHILSRKLTGSLIVRAPNVGEHAVHFISGLPVRVRLADSSQAPLGALLVEHGVLDRDALEAALIHAHAGGRLLGQQLVEDLACETRTLMTTLRAQIERRLAMLAATEDEGTYEFHLDVDLLGGFGGGEPVPGDALATLHAVVRGWRDDARIEATLKRLGDRVITVHPDADLMRFGFSAGELAVLEAAREFELSYPSLLDAEIDHPTVVRAVIYTLAITRHIDLGLPDNWPISVPKVRAPRVVDESKTGKASTSDRPLPKPTSTPPYTDPIVVKTAAGGSFRPSLIPQAPVTAPVEVMARPDSTLDARRRDLVARASSMAGRDHYAILDIGRDASPSDVQTAFLRAAKLYHPDRIPPELADVRSDAQTFFSRVGEAHRTLSDPLKRAAYDEGLSRGARGDESQQVERVLAASTEFQKAELMMRHGDLVSAERFATIAVEGDPDSSDHLALLAWIRAQRTTDLTRLIDPLRQLDVAVKRDARNDRAVYYRGAVYKRLGRANEAIRDFRTAAELNPRNTDAVREVRLHAMRTSADKKGTEKKGLRGFFKK